MIHVTPDEVHIPEMIREILVLVREQSKMTSLKPGQPNVTPLVSGPQVRGDQIAELDFFQRVRAITNPQEVGTFRPVLLNCQRGIPSPREGRNSRKGINTQEVHSGGHRSLESCMEGGGRNRRRGRHDQRCIRLYFGKIRCSSRAPS